MSAIARSAPTAALLAAALAAIPVAQGRAAGSYDFLAAPQIDLNRIFRLDKATGEVGACQFGLPEGAPVGVTLCYPPGRGAGPQGSSDYALVASRHQGEGGVWRVDLRSGTMSICYVLNETVVCTAPNK